MHCPNARLNRRSGFATSTSRNLSLSLFKCSARLNADMEQKTQKCPLHRRERPSRGVIIITPQLVGQGTQERITGGSFNTQCNCSMSISFDSAKSTPAQGNYSPCADARTHPRRRFENFCAVYARRMEAQTPRPRLSQLLRSREGALRKVGEGRPAPNWFLRRRERIPTEGTDWLKRIEYCPRNPALCAD